MTQNDRRCPDFQITQIAKLCLDQGVPDRPMPGSPLLRHIGLSDYKRFLRYLKFRSTMQAALPCALIVMRLSVPKVGQQLGSRRFWHLGRDLVGGVVRPDHDIS